MGVMTSYGAVLASNVRAARTRAGLTQEVLADRMRLLGFTAWLYQTVGNVEKVKRRLTAEEILGLALALETTMPALMGASDHDDLVDLPGGQVVGAVTVERLAGRGVNDRSMRWASADGEQSASVTTLRRLDGVDPFDRELLAQPTWQGKP